MARLLALLHFALWLYGCNAAVPGAPTWPDAIACERPAVDFGQAACTARARPAAVVASARMHVDDAHGRTLPACPPSHTRPRPMDATSWSEDASGAAPTPACQSNAAKN